MSEAEAPKGLMLAIANAHDDNFRWRVAAACVKIASSRLESAPDDAVLQRVVWEWTAFGEAMARFLAIAKGVTPEIGDDQLAVAVDMNWNYVAAGMPAKE